MGQIQILKLYNILIGHSSFLKRNNYGRKLSSFGYKFPRLEPITMYMTTVFFMRGRTCT